MSASPASALRADLEGAPFDTLCIAPRHVRINAMSRSRALRAPAGAVLAAAFVVACMTDYQKGLDDPRYGSPNALDKQTPPGPSTEALSDRDEPGGDDDDQPLCVKNGGTLLEGNPDCEVSFAQDILSAFGNAGCHQSACHGGATPFNLPPIDPGDPGAMWKGFSSFALSNGKPYINPCSTDPVESTIACNVSATGTCGVLMPQGSGLSDDVVTMIETWLKCGAPNN